MALMQIKNMSSSVQSISVTWVNTASKSNNAQNHYLVFPH